MKHRFAVIGFCLPGGALRGGARGARSGALSESVTSGETFAAPTRHSSPASSTPRCAGPTRSSAHDTVVLDLRELVDSFDALVRLVGPQRPPGARHRRGDRATRRPRARRQAAARRGLGRGRVDRARLRRRHRARLRRGGARLLRPRAPLERRAGLSTASGFVSGSRGSRSPRRVTQPRLLAVGQQRDPGCRRRPRSRTPSVAPTSWAVRTSWPMARTCLIARQVRERCRDVDVADLVASRTAWTITKFFGSSLV